MIDTALADRFTELLADGFASDHDLQWFTGPDGLLAACILWTREQLIDLLDEPAFQDLLVELDDRSVAVAECRPSERATAWVNAAIRARSRPLVATDVLGFLPCGVPSDDRDLPGLLDALTDLLECTLRGDSVPVPARSSVPIVLSHHMSGEIAEITIRRATRPGPVPDVAHAPFQRVGWELHCAVARAQAAVSTGVGVRYTIDARQTGTPLEVVDGRSVGLGAAIAIRRLVHDGAPALDPSWVFTGDLDRSGRVRSLVAAEAAPTTARTAVDSTAAGYVPKLTTATMSTLVFPAADSAIVERARDSSGSRATLIPVETIGATERLIGRHLSGRAAFEAAVRHPRRRAARRRALAGAAAGVVVVAAAAGLVTGAGDTRHSMVDLRSAADAPVVPVAFAPVAGIPTQVFWIDAHEVTNGDYRPCIEAGVCDPPRDQRHPISDPFNADFPVTGISQQDAISFCEWADRAGARAGLIWTIPTSSLYREALRAKGTLDGFPKADSDDELPSQRQVESMPLEVTRVDRLEVAAGQIGGLADNVGELTRAESRTASPQARVNVFGYSFDSVARAKEAGDTSALSGLLDQAATLTDNRSTAPTVGFRCASVPISTKSGFR